MLDRTRCPGTPCTKDSFSLDIRRRLGQYHAAGVLGRNGARHCNHAATVASSGHKAYYSKA